MIRLGWICSQCRAALASATRSTSERTLRSSTRHCARSPRDPPDIHFAPRQGRIWLDEQRMVLMASSALGVLRSELSESLGAERARGLLGFRG